MMEWIFDGIGTELAGAVIGALLGGFGGYKLGVKKTIVKQTQTAGDNAIQYQEGIKK